MSLKESTDEFICAYVYQGHLYKIILEKLSTLYIIIMQHSLSEEKKTHPAYLQQLLYISCLATYQTFTEIHFMECMRVFKTKIYYYAISNRRMCQK